MRMRFHVDADSARSCGCQLVFASIVGLGRWKESQTPPPSPMDKYQKQFAEWGTSLTNIGETDEDKHLRRQQWSVLARPDKLREMVASRALLLASEFGEARKRLLLI